MEKAWEVKGLVGGLKAKGIDMAEDAAVHLIEAVFDWTEESIKLSKTKIDDAALVLIPSLKAAALGYADKIDGKEG